MPTFVAGFAGIFKLANASGTLTDISSSIKDCKVSHDLAALDSTTLGQDAKAFTRGLKDGKITISGPWSMAKKELANQRSCKENASTKP